MNSRATYVRTSCYTAHVHGHVHSACRALLKSYLLTYQASDAARLARATPSLAKPLKHYTIYVTLLSYNRRKTSINALSVRCVPRAPFMCIAVLPHASRRSPRARHLALTNQAARSPSSNACPCSCTPGRGRPRSPPQSAPGPTRSAASARGCSTFGESRSRRPR